VIEEVIFRGFLFKALQKDKLSVAIIVSSVTFGFGHIVNLPFANTRASTSRTYKSFAIKGFDGNFFIFLLLYRLLCYYYSKRFSQMPGTKHTKNCKKRTYVGFILSPYLRRRQFKPDRGSHSYGGAISILLIDLYFLLTIKYRI
jgi:hypothetical protein